MTADLQRLEELYGKATPGEWRFIKLQQEWDGDPTYELDAPECGSLLDSLASDRRYYPHAPNATDAELIAALHNAFPSLLARIRELEAERNYDDDLTIERDQLQSQLAAAEARAAAMQGDSERYQWLRVPSRGVYWLTASHGPAKGIYEGEYVWGDDLDSAIDAARSAKEE